MKEEYEQVNGNYNVLLYLEVSALLSIMRRAAIFIMPVHCLDKVSGNTCGIPGCNVSKCIWSTSSISCIYIIFIFINIGIT